MGDGVGRGLGAGVGIGVGVGLATGGITSGEGWTVGEGTIGGWERMMGEGMAGSITLGWG
ncbi:hypothetical protein BST81_24750 [Leptolyngbya sp. 'hensonii']|nr:hypothetical protein BST81_24750 [Leptolyngbya sp. 'hensonii']